MPTEFRSLATLLNGERARHGAADVTLAATPAPLDVLVAAKAVVDWAEMAEGGNVAAEDAMFDRIDRLRAALNAQEANHE